MCLFSPVRKKKKMETDTSSHASSGNHACVGFTPGCRAGAGVFGILPNVDFTNWPVRCPSDHLVQYSLAPHQFDLHR
jgi:hypothetical protein